MILGEPPSLDLDVFDGLVEGALATQVLQKLLGAQRFGGLTLERRRHKFPLPLGESVAEGRSPNAA